MDTKLILTFLKDIAANNNRQWFQDHKADAEVQHQEDQDGQERLAVGLWFVGRIGFHKTSSE